MKQKIEGRYWNSNGEGICIMAWITEGIDWAAYIGADDGDSEEDCMETTCRFGSKLSESDARYLFPLLRDIPYRS